MIRNVHERTLAATPEEVGALIDSLASPGDRLWPAARWPATPPIPSVPTGPPSTSPSMACGTTSGAPAVRSGLAAATHRSSRRTTT